MPNKPIKFGYKSTTLSESSTGFLVNIVPYSKYNYPNK